MNKPGLHAISGATAGGSASGRKILRFLITANHGTHGISPMSQVTRVARVKMTIVSVG